MRATCPPLSWAFGGAARLAEPRQLKGPFLTNRDFKFHYDELDRLVKAERGVYNPSTQGITLTSGSQQWGLDFLGNWHKFRQDLNGNGVYTDTSMTTSEEQTRDHNFANELYQADRAAPGQPAVTIPFTYDHAGNMTTQNTTDSSYRRYKHDAWNRLVKVESVSNLGEFEASFTVAEFKYNGLHWRILKRTDQLNPLGNLDNSRIMYYDASWRLLEERIDDNDVSSPGVNRYMQNIWGARYIDDLVARRKDTDLDSNYNESGEGTWYAITDVQFSVVALIDKNAALVERNVYDAYGVAKHRYADDVDGDGDVDFADQSLVSGLAATAPDIGDPTYNADADINRDGIVDSSDTALVAPTKAALPAGHISNKAIADNIVGFAGYIYNSEFEAYVARFRYYIPLLGRWIERDPIGYVDDHLYVYVSSRPIDNDPLGLEPPNKKSNRRRPITPVISTPGMDLALWVAEQVDRFRNGHPGFNDAERAVWRTLGIDEKLCMRAAFNNALKAVMVTDKDGNIVPIEKGGGGKGRFKGTLIDGSGDAVRHCTWNCIMAHCAGKEKAKEFADAHEKGRELEDPDGTAMDLHNNEQGRKLWESIKSNNEGKCFDAGEACAKGCEDLWDQQELNVVEKWRWRDTGPLPAPPTAPRGHRNEVRR